MSEPIPESIPTSADRRSHRPTKKRALTPSSQQSAQVDALFANPDREIRLPSNEQKSKVAAPPEIVANVQGSSAGAGSGEFHVYKASRRREYERLRQLDEEVERERLDREFEEKQAEARKRDEEKLGKNQARRVKAKARKEKAKKGDSGAESGADAKQSEQSNGAKKKLGAAKVALSGPADEQHDATEDGVTTSGVVAEEEGIRFHDD